MSRTQSVSFCMTEPVRRNPLISMGGKAHKVFEREVTLPYAYCHPFLPLKSSKAPANYFTPNILRKSWSRLVVSVVHLDALAFPVAAM